MFFSIVLSLLLLFSLIPIGFILLVHTVSLYRRRRIIKLTQNIPGPKTYPIVGSILEAIGTPEYQWVYIRQLAKQYPRIFKYWVLNVCTIILQTPEDLEVFFSTSQNLAKSQAYLLLKHWLQTGLLTSADSKWKVRRKLLTPAFHFNILKNFIDTFQKQNEYTVTKILNNHLDMETDVVPIVTEHALFALCDTTMGIKIDPKNEEIRKYKQAVYKFGDYFTERLSKPWYYFDIIYFNLTSSGRKCRETIKTLQQFTTKILDERLENWEETKYQTIDSLSGKRKLPMMDLLIAQMKDENNIDYNGIREEVDTFIFEGHDTTSMGLTFLLMLLANHPHIQDKILEEQKEVLGDLRNVANYDDLQKMHYLEQCIKESLRMYPSVPMIGRTLDTDLILNDYIIPAGTNIFVLIYDLHHNAKYWPEPEKFDPDRFSPENFTNHHPFSYIPFSAGSRNCIGQRFVMLEMKSFVSQIVREFVLAPVDTPETITIKADLVMRPSKPVKVIFKKRQ